MADTPPTTIPRSQPLTTQVGGHAGVQTTDDGSLLIKPAVPIEHIFYQSVTAEPAFAPLRPWIPRFLGTLRLAEQAAPDGALVPTEDTLGMLEYDKDEPKRTPCWPPTRCRLKD